VREERREVCTFKTEETVVALKLTCARTIVVVETSTDKAVRSTWETTVMLLFINM
jgi:hypothetical protein